MKMRLTMMMMMTIGKEGQESHENENQKITILQEG